MRRLIAASSKFLSPLVNTRAAGVYLLLFAISIGVATFIENDFGTSSAQKLVYQAWWFEVLLFLFSATIIANIFKFRMIEQKKWALLSFHIAIVIILIGAGITRYLGFEGMMHIREANTASTFLSSDTYLKFKVVEGGQTYEFDEPVLFASLGNNHFEQSYLVGENLIDVKVKDFLPNPNPVLYESIDGLATLKIVIAGVNGREEYFITKGQTKRFGNVIVNFKDEYISGAINIRHKNDSLLLRTDHTLHQTIMATQEKDTLEGAEIYYPLALRALYTDGLNNIVFPEFNPRGKVKIESEDPKVKNESITAVVIDISVNGQTVEAYAYGSRGMPGRPEMLNFGGLSISVAYGAKEMELPFGIKLNKFIMDKYPGTNSAASYASEVELIDHRNNIHENYRIYMNHILNYDGYRFFQSSFDNDEKGTYLSVNHDFWGTLVSYIGYALLTAGMFLTFFHKRSRFFQLTQRIEKLRAKRAVSIILLLLSFSFSFSKDGKDDPHIHHTVSVEHASHFSELVVQDFRGRMKPMHTLSREVMRKIARKESLFGLNADQILLSMYANKAEWYHVPIIKLGKHEKILKIMGVEGGYATYADFFAQGGAYKLRDAVRRVYTLEPIDRGVYEKELLKVDERLNILSMVFSGRIFKIVPNPNDHNNAWEAANNHQHDHEGTHNHSVSERFFSAYHTALIQGIKLNNYNMADQLLSELKAYQHQKGGSIVPSDLKIKGEILLNESAVFTRLTFLYLALGMAYLSLLFFSVFRPAANFSKIGLILFSVVGVGFCLHTLGLGIRWYVSGRAPWSNGYESMIYIAWTATLAGLIFTRKSFGGLAATMILAATILFVATLSFLDPEITPLVPVLRSYWLTIHVSMIAGSYGFLMLGAIIGIINLLLMILMRESNKHRIKQIIQEMSCISELTITGGLFMISVGTYLGGVWANESWGRYWGWDAKETWALVTILVYSFILHMRLIPKLFGLFSYNLSTIFGMASVIMTYFGVNYYLSGLHSYAAGDPVPIPAWVYYAVGLVVVISSWAYVNKRRYIF